MWLLADATNRLIVETLPTEISHMFRARQPSDSRCTRGHSPASINFHASVGANGRRP